MKFKHGTRRRAAEYEKDWVQRWKDDQTFEKSVAQRPADNAYVFYDGPPFITGVPHHGTLLSSIVKDAVPRYWTMKGKRVERRWGWEYMNGHSNVKTYIKFFYLFSYGYIRRHNFIHIFHTQFFKIVFRISLPS